jgi:hypothetical protein
MAANSQTVRILEHHSHCHYMSFSSDAPSVYQVASPGQIISSFSDLHHSAGSVAHGAASSARQPVSDVLAIPTPAATTMSIMSKLDASDTTSTPL